MSDIEIEDAQPLHLTLAFSAPPIYHEIFACLPPTTLIRVSRTCRMLYRAIADFWPRAYNINRHLQRYFSNPLGFRSLQAQTDTLISGSNALQFLDRIYYPESDLDLFVFQHCAKEVGRYLIDQEGYTFERYENQPQEFEAAVTAAVHEEEPMRVPAEFDKYRVTGVEDVFCFKKGKGKSVQIVSCSTNPVHTILCFHSTIVMNFITYDAAYSLYPKATFDARIGVALGSISEREAKTLAKYALRGWRINVTSWAYDQDLSEGMYYYTSSRTVKDSKSWVLPFDTTGVTLRTPHTRSSPTYTWDPAIYNGWRLQRQGNEIRSRFRAVKSKLFEYKYVVAEDKLLIVFMDFFRSQGKFEHLKVKGLSRAESNAAWTWWDAAVPSIWAQHQKQVEDEKRREEELRKEKECQARRRRGTIQTDIFSRLSSLTDI